MSKKISIYNQLDTIHKELLKMNEDSIIPSKFIPFNISTISFIESSFIFNNSLCIVSN